MALSFPKAKENDRERQNVASTVSAPVSRVSDAVFPINDGKAVSLKQAQLESELYVKSSYVKQEQSHAFSQMTAKDYLDKFAPKKDITPKKEEYVRSPEKPEAERAAVIREPRKEVEIPAAEPCVNKPEERVEVSAQAEEPKFQKLSYKIIGELFNSYVLVETGDKALLIDKHAAHERILFEQLKAGMKNQVISSQMLMLPIEIMMTSDEISTLCEYKSDIESVGFEFSTGKYTLNVTSIPEGIKTEAVSDMLTVMADRLKNSTGSAKLTKDIVFEKALYQAACKAAIKAGREYADEHIKWIVDKLMEIPDITVCPHGRPVAVELTKKYLDNQFERI